MPTAYSRVTVMTAERAVDLALPNALPLADVLPQLLRYAAPTRSDAPSSWTVARVGGPQLQLGQSLTDAGVIDGDVLELRAHGEGPRPVVVEDVRDAVEDSVDAAGGTWTTHTTRSFVALVGSIALGLIAVAVAVGQLTTGAAWTLQLSSPVSAAPATVALVATTGWAVRYARDADAQYAAAAAMAWGAVSALWVVHRGDVGAGLTVAACAVASCAVAGGCRILTPAVAGHLAFGATVLAGAVVLLVAGTWEITERSAPRVLPVLALLAVGAVPRVSLGAGGLAAADYRVRNAGHLDVTTLQARYRASNAILIGAVAAVAAIVVWFGSGLAMSSCGWDRCLSAALAAGVLLRSRVFSRTQHMAPLRTAGLLVIGVMVVRVGRDEPALLEWVAALVAGALLIALALASLRMSEIPRARVKRSLNTLEVAVLVVTLVLMVGSLTVYEQFEGVFG